VTDIPLDASYRSLLRVPTLGRVILSMAVARVAQGMLSIAMVLFALTEYHSPELAGIVTFASTFPSIVVSPLAGVLLDRHGRTRLIILDYLVTLGALVLIGVLALAHLLPPWLLVLIATLGSLTGILSAVGLRSLFPLMVPEHLWERANAVDSNGYVLSSLLSPPIAASLVAFVGGPVALIVVGLAYGLAAVAIVGVTDPETEITATGSLLDDAWQGLKYVWRNATLRGLGFSIAVLNLTGGVTTIVVPLLVLQQLGQSEAVVGLVFAVSGVSGMVSALIFGRMDSRGREWAMLVFPTLGMAGAVALLLPVASSPVAGATGAISPLAGFLLIGASLFVFGLLNGPLDIALFTVRQRRTDPSWMGRAFAISMGFNYVGVPIGAVLAGLIASGSLTAAVLVGVVACLASALLAATLIPARDPAADSALDSAGDRATGPAT
jgi:MFS family permease